MMVSPSDIIHVLDIVAMIRHSNQTGPSMSSIRDLYTDHHAASLVKARMVGQLYEPGNGEEGDRFESLFCNQCRHKGIPEEGTGCEISLRAYWIPINDPRYPREWIYGLDGQPTCTAFTPEEEE